jgi:hypothetical protein
MIETLHMRIVVVVDSVCVEELARVVGIVPKFLQPDRKPVFVQSLLNKLGVAAIGWLDIGDVVIVGGKASPYVGSGWAADGDCAVMLLESGAFAGDVFVEDWHVVERLHVDVLIVGDDEQEIGFLLRCMIRGGKARESSPCQCLSDLHACSMRNRIMSLHVGTTRF